MSRRGWLIAGLVVLLVVGLGLLGRERDRDGPPFDPRSTGPSGTAALVEVLRGLGADVAVTGDVPTGDRGVAVLLVDGHDAAVRDGLEDWVRGGGRLVLADPSSPLNPAAVQDASTFDLWGRVPLAMSCDHPAFAGIDRVASAGWIAVEPPAEATFSCLPSGEGAALVGLPVGDGELIVFGGRGAWTNGSLAEHGNAALAAALVQPAEGVRVSVIAPPPPGAGDRTLAELVPDRVRMALWQLVIAFGVLAWARSRRHGAPVQEELPTRLRGSETVAAVGGLLERGGARGAAATGLRDDLARSLGDLLGVPRDASRETLVDVASRRTGIPRDRLREALADREVTDDRQLVALTRAIASVRSDLGAVGTGRRGVGRPDDVPMKRQDDLST